MIFSDDYIEHYGVKGMKWGVRNSRYGYNGMPSDVVSKISSSSTVKKKAKKAVASILGSTSSSSKKKSSSGKSAAQKAKEKAEKEEAKKKKAEETAAKKAAKEAEKASKNSEKSKASANNEKLKKELADSKKAYEELLKQKQKTQISETYTKYLEDILNRNNKKSKLESMSTDEKLNKIKRLKSKKSFPSRTPSGMRHFDDASIMIFSNELLKPPTIDVEFLEHHGILGQKWGKKNGPPYPLDEGNHSAKEKKDGYKKSLGGGRNEKLYNRNSRKPSKEKVTKEKIDNHRKEMIAYYNKKGDKSGAEVYKNATDEQIKTEIQHREAVKKALIIGGTAVGIGVAAYVIYSRKSLHDFNVVKDALTKGDLSNADDLLKKGLSIDTANKIITLDAKKKVISDDEVFKIVKNGVLNDMDLTIKNARFQRMDFNPDFDISKVKNPLFVGADKKTTDKYLGYYTAGMIRNRSGAGKDSEVFQLTLDALEDIKIPSREKAKQIYADIMKLDPDFDNDMRKACEDMYSKNNLFFKALYPNGLSDTEWNNTKSESHIFNGKKIFDVEEYIPNQIMGGAGIAKEKLSKAFEDNGFNAILDVHDIFDRVSDLPLILLNNNLEVVKKTKHVVA